MSEPFSKNLSTAAYLRPSQLTNRDDRRLCPRCQTPLTDPDGLGACESCGYCHSLTQKAGSAQGTTKRPKLGVGELGEAFSLMPAWMAVMLGGCFLLLAGCLLGNHLLPAYCTERA